MSPPQLGGLFHFRCQSIYILLLAHEGCNAASEAHTEALAFYICYMQSLKNDDIGKLFFKKHLRAKSNIFYHL